MSQAMQRRDHRRSALLTEKELRVLKMKIEGLMNREIAEKLSVSEEDISQTLSRVRAKVTKVEDSIALFKSLDLIKDEIDFRLTEKGRQFTIPERAVEEKTYKQAIGFDVCICERKLPFRVRVPYLEIYQPTPLYRGQMRSFSHYGIGLSLSSYSFQ